MNTLKRVLVRGAIAVGITGALVMGSAPAAQAAGAVANSCAVKAEVMVARQVKGGGINPYWLKCGEAMGNITWATVHGRPFYVKLPGTAPICLKAGQRFYPNNKGFERTAVLTPTVRCR